MEERQNEQALDNAGSNTAEAQALNEMSSRIKKLEEENKDLLNAKKQYYDSVLNGGTVEVAEPKHRSSSEIRKEMAKTCSSNTNLRNWELSIELDEAVRRETGLSSYLPKGHEVSPTVEELTTADVLHDTMKECIELAEGDPERFNAELRLRKL